jgi:hypothetical protein
MTCRRKKGGEDNSHDYQQDDKQACNLYWTVDTTCDNEMKKLHVFYRTLLYLGIRVTQHSERSAWRQEEQPLVTTPICRESGFTRFVPCNAVNVTFFVCVCVCIIHRSGNVHLPTRWPASHLTLWITVRRLHHQWRVFKLRAATPMPKIHTLTVKWGIQNVKYCAF